MRLTIKMLPMLGVILISLHTHAIQATEKTLAFQFLGTADQDVLSTAVRRKIRQLGFNVPDLLREFECYELDLRDPGADISIGTAVDCVAPIDVGQADNLIVVEAKSFFLLPRGSLVSEGVTSVAPFIPGIGDAGGEFTHMTGSIPESDDITITSVIGEFKRTIGNARVSGAVDLSSFPGSATFNCLFQVVLIDGDDS